MKYSAEMDILDASEPFAVEMLSIYPSEWGTAEEIEVGRQMIQRGAVAPWKARVRPHAFECGTS